MDPAGMFDAGSVKTYNSCEEANNEINSIMLARNIFISQELVRLTHETIA
jgi:hypothetical protein